MQDFKVMKYMNKIIFLSILVCCLALSAFPQNAISNIQRTSYKLPAILSRMEDSLRKQFEQQKIPWPPEALYIRSFKYDRQLEVWVKGNVKEPYRLFKTYKVC